MFRKSILVMGVMALLLAGAGLPSGVWASFQVPQTALDGTTVPKYQTPLPHFAGARVAAGNALAISYREFQQKVLPDSFYAGLPASITPYSGPGPAITFNPQLGTYVWGYGVGGAAQNYPGFTVEAQKGTATAVTYTNNLGTAGAFPILQRYLTVDQTLMWANPLNLPEDSPDRFNPYSGPHPVVPHLHGGEVRSDSDGGPDSWWTPGGEGTFFTPPAAGGIRGPGFFTSVYTYPNSQEATTLWFHDHVLGVTRTNVYAGLAAFWLIRDQFDTGIPGAGLNLPAGPQEIELVFQDRQFDTFGQWLFPDGYPAGLTGDPPNPSIHPFWSPESFGDVIVVNGRSWPYLQVEPRRYRFRLLNGSNTRAYQIRLENKAIGTPGPPIYVIGTDGGLLDAPAITSSTPSNRLVISPGERYDLIIDFANFAGQSLTILNTANSPFPDGPIVPDPLGTAEIMQFQVSLPLVGTDTSFNPAAPGATLRGGAGQPPAIVRLTDGAGGPAVTVNRKRQIVIREVFGLGGPREVLVNNTRFNGLREGSGTPVTDSNKVGVNYVTELPQIGSSEIWEIINLTNNAHPMHLHLVQFQLMNRQEINDTAYSAAWRDTFPGGGGVIDGYGPPMDYNTVNADGAIGGNPAVSPFHIGPIETAFPYENGWKDTITAYPGKVTRIIARWAPQDLPVNGVRPGQNLFPFNPTYGPGYVWHCHIIDHEDNEMMRPYIPTRNANNTFSQFGAETPAVMELLLFADP